MVASRARPAPREAPRPGSGPRARRRGRGQPGELERGREEIDEPYRAREAAPPGNPRRAHQERHVQRRLVGEEAVHGLPVLARGLRRGRRSRPTPCRRSSPSAPRRVVEAPDELVGPGHLAVVGPARRSGRRRARAARRGRGARRGAARGRLARCRLRRARRRPPRSSVSLLLDGVQELRIAGAPSKRSA